MGTVQPTLLPVPVLHKAAPATEPSKSDPPSSPLSYLDHFKFIGLPHPPIQMQHGNGCILLPRQPGRVHRLQVAFIYSRSVFVATAT